MKAARNLILFLILIMGIGGAVRGTLEKRETGRALDALKIQGAEVRLKIAQLDARLRAANEGRSGLESELTAARAAVAEQAKAQETGSAKQAVAARPFSAEIALVNHPEKGAEYSRGLREGFALTYAGLFASLRLTPEKIEEAMDLLVSLEMSRLDLIATEATQKLDAAISGKAWNEWYDMRRTKLAEVFGEHTERFREWEKTRATYELALRLASNVGYSNEPVTPAQVERMTQILAAQSTRAPNTNLVVKGTVDWPAASRELRSFLSPAQLETLGDFVQSDWAEARLNEQRKRLSAQLKNGAPAK